MHKKYAEKLYSDEEVVNRLTSGRFEIDDYFIEEIDPDVYIYSATSGGVQFEFFGEDEIFHRAALKFLRKKGARIVPYED